MASRREGMMESSADRSAALVQAIEATVSGDSRVVGELYADDVRVGHRP